MRFFFNRHLRRPWAVGFSRPQLDPPTNFFSSTGGGGEGCLSILSHSLCLKKKIICNNLLFENVCFMCVKYSPVHRKSKALMKTYRERLSKAVSKVDTRKRSRGRGTPCSRLYGEERPKGVPFCASSIQKGGKICCF